MLRLHANLTQNRSSFLARKSIKLLSFAHRGISVQNAHYSSSICTYILKNNLVLSDLPILFQNYDQYKTENQNSIFTLAIENIAEIIKGPKFVSSVQIDRLLEMDGLKCEAKIDLFVTITPNLNMNQLKNTFNLLGFSEYLKIFSPQSRPRFPIDEINEKLLSSLQKNG